MRSVFASLIGVVMLAGCATTPPTASEQTNICDIFDNRKSWYRTAAKVERKWGAPVELQMAIIKQESSFDKNARPPRGRRRFLGLVRGQRPSSARGYPQALDGTWDSYKSSTGNSGASRSNFSDSVDFIGWYVARTSRQTGLSPSNARGQYLAYHEGPAGYNNGSWRNKSGLLRIADRVAANTAQFERQLASCERRLRRRGLFG